MMEQQGIPAVICFNKKDLGEKEELERLYQTYTGCGYQVVLSSTLEGEGIDEIRQILRGKTTVVAGPSGVGKSSITNCMQGEIQMETGEISRKLKRGKAHYQTFPGNSCGEGYIPCGYAGIFFFVSYGYGRR